MKTLIILFVIIFILLSLLIMVFFKTKRIVKKIYKYLFRRNLDFSKLTNKEFKRELKKLMIHFLGKDEDKVEYKYLYTGNNKIKAIIPKYNTSLDVKLKKSFIRTIRNMVYVITISKIINSYLGIDMNVKLKDLKVKVEKN